MSPNLKCNFLTQLSPSNVDLKSAIYSNVLLYRERQFKGYFGSENMFPTTTLDAHYSTVFKSEKQCRHV